MSIAHVSKVSWAPLVFIKADGGSRRERGAAIAAAVRKLTGEGYKLERYHIMYDEAHGFQTRTESRYKVLKQPV